MIPFIWAKIGASPYGERGRGPKTSENQPQNEVFGLISWNFQDYIKNRHLCDA